MRNVISVVAAGVAAYLVDSRLIGPGLSTWIGSPVVFLATFLAGRLFQPASRKQGEPFFLEDFIRDIVAYLLLGVLTAAAIWLAGGFIGGQARPWLPALGIFVFFTFYHRVR